MKRKIVENILKSHKSNQDLLNEVLMSPYDYTYRGGTYSMYRFINKTGDAYNVIFTPIDMDSVSIGSPDQEDVLFLLGYARERTHSSTEMTGNREVFSILATVTAIVRDFIQKRYREYPDFDAAIYFGGVPDFSGGETQAEVTKRSKVYGRFVQKVVQDEPGFEFHSDENAFYIYPTGRYDIESLKDVVRGMDRFLPTEFRGYQK